MCFVQLLNTADGTRSPAFGGSRIEVATALLCWCIEQGAGVGDSHMVIVLVDDATDSDWNFSTAPLLTVKNFIDQFGA